MNNKDFVIDAERMIRRFKEAPILMLEHTNDYATNKVIYRCQKCLNKVSTCLCTDKYLHVQIIQCPTCKDNKDIAHINLIKN